MVSRWPWRIESGKIGVKQVVELRLVVPQINLRRRAIHEQVDEAARLGREVRQARQGGCAWWRGLRRGGADPGTSSEASAMRPAASPLL